MIGMGLVGHKKLTTGDITVYIRLVDLQVNVTYIFRAASLTDVRRQIKKKLGNSVSDIVMTSPLECKGTFVEPTVALSVCEVFGCNELGQALRKTLEEYGYVDKGAILANTPAAIAYEAPSQCEIATSGPGLPPLSLTHGNKEMTTAASDPVGLGSQKSEANALPNGASTFSDPEWDELFFTLFEQSLPGLEMQSLALGHAQLALRLSDAPPQTTEAVLKALVALAWMSEAQTEGCSLEATVARMDEVQGAGDNVQLGLAWLSSCYQNNERAHNFVDTYYDEFMLIM